MILLKGYTKIGKFAGTIYFPSTWRREKAVVPCTYSSLDADISMFRFPRPYPPLAGVDIIYFRTFFCHFTAAVVLVALRTDICCVFSVLLHVTSHPNSRLLRAVPPTLSVSAGCNPSSVAGWKFSYYYYFIQPQTKVRARIHGREHLR